MNKRKIVSNLIPFLGAFIIVGGLFYWWRGDSDLSAPIDEDLSVEAQAPSSLLEFRDQYENSLEVAQWIFKNHNCQTCHTLSESGFLGLTAQGQVMAEDFQGCPGLLQEVWETVGVPELEWTTKQKTVRVEFERFGCTACHQVGPSSVELTEIGAKAAVLHMGCSGVLSTVGAVSHGESAEP